MRAKTSARGTTIYNFYKNDSGFIPLYTPTGSADPAGRVGAICTDDDYFYVKQPSGWTRVAMNAF